MNAPAGLPVVWRRNLLPIPPPRVIVPRRAPAFPPSHDIPLGYFLHDNGRLQPLAYGPDKGKSLVTIAPSGSGKFLTQLGAELACYGGTINGVTPSLIVNDSKGELCPVASRARALLGDLVFRLDPFGIVAPSEWCAPGRINLLEGLAPASPTFTSDIETLAAALIIDEGSDPHWSKRARQLVTCILAHLCVAYPGKTCLPDLMAVLGLPPDAFRAFMEPLTHSPVRLVRNLAGHFTADTKEVAAIISTAVGQLNFLNDDNIAACLTGPSSFT